MSVYIYDSHLGGWFADNRPIPDDELYCETCGDWDMLVGCYDSLKDFLEQNADDICIGNRDGGYELHDVMDRITYMFDDKLTLDEAKAIVKASKTYEEEEDNER